MHFKRIILVFILLSFSILNSSEILIDRIVAVINNEIITMSDLDLAVKLYPIFRNPNEDDKEYYNRILEELINYKIVFLEYKNEFSITEQEYYNFQTIIIKKIGSYNNLIKILKKYNMNWEDLKEFIKFKIIYDKVIRNKLQLRIYVNYKDIEDFYKNNYLAVQKSLNLKPKSLIEIAPLIEEHIANIKKKKILNEWIKELRKNFKIIKNF